MGLHYLKYTYDLSDEEIVRGYTENPYWQYFCGGRYFEHGLPFDPSSMSYWRKRVKENGAEQMLSESIKSGMRLKMIKAHQLKRINVDTTVQPKNIRFPTDARLYERMRERLVKEAKKEGIALRQGYNRVAKKHLHRQSGYARAKQMIRARKETKKLKGILGRVMRDIQRKGSSIIETMGRMLELAERLLAQERHDKNKLYSIHEPLVECIAKGKPHKPYEFGCKVSLATTAKGNWVIGSQALHQNPWDGHTLQRALDQVERLTGTSPQQATVDMGYRGNDYNGPCQILVANRYRKKIPKALRYCLKRRSAIEPTIGHVKKEHRMGCNYLKGIEGDKINALLAAAGMNLSKILALLIFLRRLCGPMLLVNRPEWSQWRSKGINMRKRSYPAWSSGLIFQFHSLQLP